MGKGRKKKDENPLKDKRENYIRDLLFEVKDALTSMPASTNVTIEDAEKWANSQGIKIPFHILSTAIESTLPTLFSFDTPKTVNVIGSMMFDAMLSSSPIDVSISMAPFAKKDELNHKYFNQRIFFLARVAVYLREKIGNFESLEWKPFGGVSWIKPILCCCFAKNVSIHFHVSAVAEGDGDGASFFKLDRALSSKNLVRPTFMQPFSSQQQNADNESAASISSLSPTPVYNNILLSDCKQMRILRLIHRECRKNPSLSEAIRLGKAWCTQRWPSHVFSTFQFTALCAYLSWKGILTAETSQNELETFKSIANWIAGFWTDSPLLFDCSGDWMAGLDGSSLCCGLFVDELNLFWNLGTECKTEIQMYAKQTLQDLSQYKDIQQIFSKKTSPLLNGYGCMMTISNVPFSCFNANLSVLCNEGLQPCLALATKCKEILKESSLFTFVHCFADQVEEGDSKASLTLCLIPKVPAIRLIKGPLADDHHACAKFRQFWGNVCELRRFKDASMRECVPVVNYSESVQGLLKRHLGSALVYPHDSTKIMGKIDQNTHYKDAFLAFEELSKAFSQLSQLPLSIIKSECVNLRPSLASPPPIAHSKLSPPSQTILPTHQRALKCIVFMESSSRWPQDRLGLLFAKQSFMAEICSLLQDTFGFDCTISEDYFHVYCSDQIFECHLMIGLSGEASCRDEKIKSEILQKESLHSQMINKIASDHRFYSQTVLLLKRLFDEMYLSFQTPAEFVELLAAHAFQHFVSEPSTLESAFLMGIRWICLHSWSNENYIDYDCDKSSSDTISNVKVIFCEGKESEGRDLGDLYSWWNEGTGIALKRLHLDEILERTFDLVEQNIEKIRFSALFSMASSIKPTLTLTSKNKYNNRMESKKKENVFSRKQCRLISKTNCRFLTKLPGFDPILRCISDLSQQHKIVPYYNENDMKTIILCTIDKSSALEDVRKDALSSGLFDQIYLNQ